MTDPAAPTTREGRGLVDMARDLWPRHAMQIEEHVLAIEAEARSTPAEAAQGAAPRVEGLVEKLRQAINKTDVFSYNTNHDAHSLAEEIARHLAAPRAEEHGPNDGCAELLWAHVSADPGFDEELRQARADIAEGHGVPLRSTPAELAAPTTPDWTADASGRSNSSPLFEALIEEMARLIRQEAHFLLQGDTESAARLIMAQLAHKHGLGPARSTPAEALDVERLAAIWDRMHELTDLFPWYEMPGSEAAPIIVAEYIRFGGEQGAAFSLADRITAQVRGIPCAGHEDFAAGTWTFHREGDCP